LPGERPQWVASGRAVSGGPGWKADIDTSRDVATNVEMNIDLPTLARFLSQPIVAVEVALPTSLNRQWTWGSKVRTNFAAIRTPEGALLFRFGAATDGLLTGIFEDNPYEGYGTEGTLALLPVGDAEGERELLDIRGPMQSHEPLEMVALSDLFPDAGPIYVPDATAFEVSYTQVIRDGAFRFGVSGIRIWSTAASTMIERGSGGVLECSIQS
jgi:hypothetical protein